MLDEKGRTMLEYMQGAGRLPELPEPSSDTVDGEFTEVE
jgi:hypothetical protein